MTKSTSTKSASTVSETELAILRDIASDPAKLSALQSETDAYAELMSDPACAQIINDAIADRDKPETLSARLKRIASEAKTAPKQPADARTIDDLSVRHRTVASKSARKIRANYRDNTYRPGKEGDYPAGGTEVVELFCSQTGKIYERLIFGRHEFAAIDKLRTSKTK